MIGEWLGWVEKGWFCELGCGRGRVRMRKGVGCDRGEGVGWVRGGV